MTNTAPDGKFKLGRVFRYEKIAAGMCAGCLTVPARPGKMRCAECAKKASDHVVARSKAFRAEGLCAGCGKVPPLEGRPKCQKCLDYGLQRSREFKQRRKQWVEDTNTCKSCFKAPRAEGKKCCEECLVAARLLRFRGLGFTREHYDRMEKKCAICGATKFLSIDHDHAGGYVRGTLCRLCNQGLGLFQDNPELVEKASQYLRQKSDVTIEKNTPETTDNTAG